MTRLLPIQQPGTERQPRLPVPWAQGEHVSVVGDTGTGKTFLLSRLAEYRSHVVLFRTKLDTEREPHFGGFKYADSANALEDGRYDKIVLTPKYRDQGKQGYAMLEKVWQHGRWCVMIDELWYADQVLGLRSMIDKLLTQGRSARITVVVGMQRPAFVSRFALSQCTHVFSFRVEGRDLKTMREAFTNRLAPLIDDDSPQAVSGHDFAYFNRSRRIIAEGNANQLQQIISRPTNP